MRRWFSLLLLLALPVSPVGCGPALSKTDLGTVVFEIPKVPGADTAYRMPQLEGLPPQAKDSDAKPLP